MAAAKTIFKRILDKEIPADIVYEDDRCIAICDINAQAPTHVLIIPRQEIVSLADTKDADAPLLGHLLVVAASLAAQLGLTGGYRTVINCGRDGGQSVDHLHVHLLGGRSLMWPPG
jgi:histidine triad (HIT) family protein